MNRDNDYMDLNKNYLDRRDAIFRKEAVEYQKQSWIGDYLDIERPASWWVATLLAFLIVTLLVGIYWVQQI